MTTLQGIAAESLWIRTVFEDGWTATPISWDATAFNPPNPPEPYVRPLFRRSGGEQASLGPDPIDRYDAMLVVEVRTPIDGTNQGTAENDELCDAVERLFRRKRGPGIRFRTPHTERVGPVDGWFKQDVLCPYVRDTIYT